MYNGLLFKPGEVSSFDICSESIESAESNDESDNDIVDVEPLLRVLPYSLLSCIMNEYYCIIQIKGADIVHRLTSRRSKNFLTC